MNESVEDLVLRGIRYANEGKRSKAKEYFRRALELLPEDPIISFNLALELMTDESWAEALDFLNQSISAVPDNGEFWLERGIALFQLGRLEEAEESYDMALTYGEESSRLWNGYGVLRFGVSKYEEAELFFRRSIELDENNPDPWFNLADTLDELGNEKGASAARHTFERLMADDWTS